MSKADYIALLDEAVLMAERLNELWDSISVRLAQMAAQQHETQ